MHPGSRRCSSVAYARYSSSSRLARRPSTCSGRLELVERRAPHRSRCYTRLLPRAPRTVRLSAHARLVEEGSDRGTITVGTRRAGEWAEIFVRDTGPGIPDDVRARIFDPFFTTKAVGKGTGQGLPIVRSMVVDKHGGTIDCKTERGQGTTFTVRIPISPKEKPHAAVA